MLFLITSCGLTRQDLTKKEYVWTKYKVKEKTYWKKRNPYSENERTDTLSKKLVFSVKTRFRSAGCDIVYRYVYSMRF